MKLLTILLFSLIGVFVPLDSIGPGDIARRHDVDDSKYLELGAAFPQVVRVGEKGGDGTLIGAEWVITAAHVAEGMTRRSGGTFRVFVDGTDEGYVVAQVILHPEFEPMGPNDIALIRLEKPVDATVSAGLFRGRNEKGQKLILVGHGDTKTGIGGAWVVDRQKRGATNMVDDATDSHIIFDFDDPDSATELEGTAGPGDSGGPAFIEVGGHHLVAGISSLGEPGKDGPGTYGAREHYVRVSSHTSWIDEMMDNPPQARLVNLPDENRERVVRRAGPGAGQGSLPPGVEMLREIGLMVSDRGGAVVMVGREDRAYPDVLLNAGIRPPARFTALDGMPIETAKTFKKQFDAVAIGTSFVLDVEHQGKKHTFQLVK